MTQNELIAAFTGVGIVAFFIGRFSTRVAFFHSRTEEKLTVPEFVRQRHS